MVRVLVLALVTLLCGIVASPQAQRPHRKRLLAIGEVKGFQHDSVSHGLATIERIGYESGEFDTFIRTDSQLITKKKLTAGNARNLDQFDGVLFFTTGELDLDDEQKASLISFVKDDGKAFFATHTGTDTYYHWPEYGEMVGGYFDDHPWHKEVRVKIEDPSFPGMKYFTNPFTVNDEIYQLKNFSRDKVRVLMTLDTTSVDMTSPRIKRTDGDFAIAWARNYGKGRVFSCTLGHEPAVWDRKDFQSMWLDAIKWGFGELAGDATPRPKP
jgi:uncharacterized protein